MPKKKKSIKPFRLIFNIKGQNEREGVFFSQPDSAKLIQNLHMEELGQYSAHRQGNSNFSVELESAARIDSLGAFKTTAGVDKMLCAVNGKIKEINAGTGADVQDLTTDNTAGNLVDFEVFQGSVYMTEGTMVPKLWNGTDAVEDLTVFPLTIGTNIYNKPKIVESFNNRLAFLNFENFNSHLAVTDTLTPNQITTATTNDSDGSVLEVNPGDGQDIRAGRTIFVPSLAETYLVIWKDRSIYAMAGATPSTFSVQRINSNYGCLNNNCVVEVGNDLLFIDENNIYSLTTAFQSGTLQPKVIGSERVRETLRDLNISQKEKAWITHMPDRQEVWFGIPTGSSTEVDTILVYRYPDNPNSPEQLPVWTIRKGMSTTSALILNRQLYTGNATGYIQQWFGASKYAGTAINWVYKYPFFNFGSQFQNKRLLLCHVWFLIREEQPVTIKYRWRRSDAFKTVKTVTKTLSSGDQPVYDTAIYDTAVYATKGGSLAVAKIPITGNGTQLQFEVSGATDDTGPIFLGITGLVEFGAVARSYR